MGKLKKISVSLLFLILSNYSFSDIGNNNLTIMKDIDFEVEIGTVIDLDLDPVDIDFGNIVRDSSDTVIKTSNLKFKSAFNEDNKVTTNFPEELDKNDTEYGKFELEYQKMEKEVSTNEKEKLPVYIKKIKDKVVKKGEIEIPITAEIRGVPKDQRLGKYKKNIKMNVITIPVNPIKSIRKSGEGGMK